MRKLAIAAAVSLGLASVSSRTIALGLGEIEIYSALNQNLDAEIGLVSVAPGELAGVTVNLADEEAFARAGLSITPVLRSLRFEVEQRPDGALIVKVFSDVPVVEPFLNFLVEIGSSSSASQTREYTLLLDPPTFMVEQQPAQTDPVAGLDSTDVAVEIEDIAVADSTPNLVVGLDNNVAVASGAEVDLSNISVGADDAGDTVVFTEQGADGTVAELPLADTGNVIETMVDDGGEAIDLSNELGVAGTIAQADDASVDVALDQLSPDNAIFTSEAEAADDAQNIVNLDDVAQEDLVDALANDVNLVSDTVREQGLSISLDPVEGDTQDLASVDLSDESPLPEVTLEPIENLPLADISGQVDAIAVVDETPQVALPGIDVDLSGIDETDASLPVDSAELEPADELPVVEISEETIIVTPVAEPQVAQSEAVIESGDATAEPEGEALDISGVVVNVADAETPADSIATTPVPDGAAVTYRVKREDTLWSIAGRQRPAGISTNRMMRIIVDANPQAFANGDMNSMREGALLTIPGGTGADEANESAATVPNVAMADNTSTATESVEPAVEPSAPTQISTDLDEVNKRMILAQEELTAEAQQRDELSNRVIELEDNLTRMKELITLRESELTDLETELTDPQTDEESAAPEDNAEAPAIADSETAGEVDDKVRQIQDQINEDVALAQERVDAQADADRNLASAQAEAKSIRLAGEEDALRQQLAQLQLEKEELKQTAQADKLELVRQAEAEKAQLLDNASAERASILARLEEEKQRISDEAAAERARIAADAEAEKEQVIAEAQAERDRLAAESEAMRNKLEALETENSELVAQAELDKEQRQEAARVAQEEQDRLLAEAEAEKQKVEEESTRVKDKLAELQAEANANLANSAENQTIDRNVNDTDAEGAEATDLAVPALVGGGLAVAPLEREIGDRKKVLAAGGGIALLGLLGAWALRRKKPAPVKGGGRTVRERAEHDIEEPALGKPVATRFDNQRSNQYENVDSDRPSMGQAAVAASAAAAATGAAVASRGDEEVAPAEQPSVDVDLDEERSPPIVEDGLVDDTITEADVYLRYGLHGQAEDLLKTAIDKSPDVPEYQVKLLESYHDQKNTAEFKPAAENFRNRFGESAPQWSRIAEMGRNLDSSDGAFSRLGAMAAGGAAVGAVAATGDTAASETEIVDAALDETIDASEEFSVSDLEATGDLSALTDSLPDDLDEISLDEVDMAALDDDGTLNLEELTGDQMSGLDLGTLDLTNPEGDSTLDNLTLDDADFNSLGDVTSGVREGLSGTDIDLDEGTISRTDEMETMLDLAKAYIDMGDSDSAESALKDIVNHGSDAQKMEAQDLLSKLK